MTTHFTQPTPEQFRMATAELRELSAPYAHERLVFRPPIEPPEQIRRLEAACQAVFEGLDAVLRDVCDGDVLRMAALCRAAPPELPLLTYQTHQDWSTVARPDVIASEGRTVVVEINGDAPAGLFGVHDIIARTQDAFRQPSPEAPTPPAPAIRGLLNSLERSFGRLDGTVAICYWRHEQQLGPLNWQYELFVRELQRHGVSAAHGAVEDLELLDDGVRLDGRPVQAIYRYFESPDPAAQDEFALLKRLFSLADAGAVGLFTGYRAEILASKAALAVLSDETVVGQLGADLRNRLAAHVPWTRVLEPRRTMFEGHEIDLLPWVERHREGLILKPVRGYGGIGITVGREVSPEAWGDAVAAAVQSGTAGHPFIAQQVFDPDPVPVVFMDATGQVTATDTISVNGVFIVDGGAVAVLRRYAVNATGTININPFSGYAPSPLWSAR